MQEEICKEKFKNIGEKLNQNSKAIIKISESTDKLENWKCATEVEIRNLVKQIKDLVATMRLFIKGIGGVMLLFIGFFIWYVQSL